MMRKLEAEQRRLEAKVRAIDPNSAEGRRFLDWLAEETILGGVGGTWPKPRLVVSNKSEEEAADVSAE
jgi:hypothetical protein